MRDNGDVDIANLAASWASVIATVGGLWGVFAQADAIKSRLDPFYACRGTNNLGLWAEIERKSAFLQLRERFFTPSTPRGPILRTSLNRGFCGQQLVHLSRKPKGEFGKASWTKIFAVFHPRPLALPPGPSVPREEAEADKILRDLDPEKGSVQIERPAFLTGDVPVYTWQDHWNISSHAQSARLNGEARTTYGKRRIDESYGMQDLVQHDKNACLKISRKTLITCLVVANAYQCCDYIGDAGLRMMFSGYSGSWQVHWRIGGAAVVEFMGLDSHEDDEDLVDGHKVDGRQITWENASIDPPYPPSIPRRVDKCILMFIGVLHPDSPDMDKLGFPEPEESGTSVLRFGKRDYATHGRPTHLYNMMGGKPFDIDCLYHERLDRRTPSVEAEEVFPSFGPRKGSGPVVEGAVRLFIPAPRLDLNRKPRRSSSMPYDTGPNGWSLWVPEEEQYVLADALDCLPWSYLTWSVHRGMQCILCQYGKAIMDAHRPALAYTLRKSIKEHGDELERRGWGPDFFRDIPRKNVPSHLAVTELESTSKMANTAALSVLKEEGGDSGDSIRIVTDAARVCSSRSESQLDKTCFWRNLVGRKVEPVRIHELDEDAVIALTKLVVLDWSNELCHHFYEDLPQEMLVA
ncbi:MAG: hypothetical protein M1817_006329 [Caeruleum heppii]|nr:MAG: hypothetical protein M1817_006329 [Caeruleum heppii]